MSLHLRSLRNVLLLAALLFSTALGGATYFLVSKQFERSVREEAVADAAVFAELTFNSMFQLMSTGWTRPQLESFLNAIQHSVRTSSRQIDIYRGETVSELFGPIEQKQPDKAVISVFASGKSSHEESPAQVRFLHAMKAEQACLRCHINARPGDVLGVIDVRQDVASVIDTNRRELLLGLAPLAPVALVATLLMVVYIRRRIDASLGRLTQRLGSVNKLADLRDLKMTKDDFGFSEFKDASREISQLGERIRNIAVDKDMLEFEIKLLEKFVLTSDVIKDWRDYIIRLLLDIDSVMPSYALFSIFKIGDDAFDVEVFWRYQPDTPTRTLFERGMHEEMRRAGFIDAGYAMHISHHIADRSRMIPAVVKGRLVLQSKSLLVDAPKIGGIVGIGMQAQEAVDPNRALVIDSVLSTLMNVVGSVKAIDKYTKELEYYATRDPLTNFYNQRVFWEVIENEIHRSARHSNKFCLLVIDIDNFKSVNDTWGHGFGDVFLQLFAQALQAATRDDDMPVRYGGDEFVVILPETDLEGAQLAAERIMANITSLAVETPDGSRATASCSIGIGCYPDHTKIAKDLFLFADNMMYRAKADGKNRIATPSEDDVVEIFRSLGEKNMMILAAVENRGVRPFYQPIVASEQGQVRAIEVLSRIQLEDGSYMIADDYVAIAERMGVMHKLDYILMEQALRDADAAGFEGFLFLNMSPRALVLNDFVAETRRIAANFKFPPERIVFEITERETIKNMAVLERFIRTLHGEGFKLAIDDFGSGFSSFHYVKRFPIDFLKIEGDFILGMKSNEKDRALVRSIVSLAKELGIRTVAEYVEDQAVLDQVVAQGIDLAQGYYIMRPNPSLADAMRCGQLNG